MADIDSDEELSSSSGSDSTWSDTDSFDEDVEEFDLMERIKNGQEVRFTAVCPSTMITMGRSKMGKSTLATHLIIGQHIRPRPMMYFLVLNAHDATIIKKMCKNYVEVILAVHKGDPYKPIYKIKTSVTAMMSLLNEETKRQPLFPEIPKMIIIDDQMYSNTPNSIQEMINVYGHHTHAFVYVTAHNMFTRNQQHVRDNCDYITIFPGQEQARLKRLLANYPAGTSEAVAEVFSSEKQKAQDGLIDVPVPMSIPVIIDRTIDKISQNYYVIWAGIDDRHPKLVPIDEINTILDTEIDELDFL